MDQGAEPESADPGGTSASLESTTDASEANVEVETIQAQIEETRAEMSETIDAIQEKLSPDQLKEQAKESVRQATIGRASQAVDTAGRASAQAASRVRSVAAAAGSAAAGKARQWPVALAVGAIVLTGVVVGIQVIQARRRARIMAQQSYQPSAAGVLARLQDGAGTIWEQVRDAAGLPTRQQ